MAMTLRLTDNEQAALRERAEAEGISMQDAARRAVREFVSRGQHRDRVGAAATVILTKHADALRRLGE
jgi:predicted transcriptional regulator